MKWVIGSGGLIGGAIQAQLPSTFRSSKIEWDSESTISQLTSQWQRYRAECAPTNSDWTIYWCAGRATVSSDSATTAKELSIFKQFIDFLSSETDLASGKFFLTSSAGGIYAGSSNPPFGIDTIARPVSDYGNLKLQQENYLVEKLSENASIVIGRVSNVYGPGQNLNKLQGLISHLVWSSITRQPTNLFVPLETLRDYIYVTDAAAMAINALDAAHSGISTQIIASGEPVTIAELISLTQSVSRKKVPLGLGVHESSDKQTIDLRMKPTLALPANATDLLSGIKNVYLDMLARVQNQGITA